MLTVVESAMLRRLPVSALSSNGKENNQKAGEDMSASSVVSDKRKIVLAINKRSRVTIEAPTMTLFFCVIHNCPEKHAGKSDQQHVGTAQDREYQYRPGFKVYPERKGAPEQIGTCVGN